MKKMIIPVWLLTLVMLLVCFPFAAFGEAAYAAPNLQEISVVNTPVQGKIGIEKMGLMLTGFEVKEDAWGNAVHQPVYEEGNLIGAVFNIVAAEKITGKDGTQWFENGETAASITTTAVRVDESKLLPLGHYEVVEAKAPDGYLLDETRYAIELKAIDNQTPIVAVGLSSFNTFMPAEITLTKEVQVLNTVKDEQNQVCQELKVVPGEGFVFGLYTVSDIVCPDDLLPANSLVATGKTDANGHLALRGYFPHGSYYMKELSGPDGWKLREETFPVIISPDDYDKEAEVIKVDLGEPILNELILTTATIIKTDLSNKLALPGTWLEVTNEAGNVVYSGYTDVSGSIQDMLLVPGKYTFREMMAPDGYELREEPLSFYVTDSCTVYGDTLIADDVTRFSILKVDEKHEPLAGAEFGLKAADGSIVMTAVSDENGIAVFEMVPCGDYTIVETKAANGYILSDAAVPVSVTPTFVNPSEPLAVIDNCPNEVVVMKVDQNNNPLAGAKVGLYDDKGTLVMEAVSGEDGLVRFAKVPSGSYTIRENEAPEGYLLSRSTAEFTIDGSWKNTGKPIAALVNHLKKIMFLKVDTSGKPVEGIEFSLINAANGQIVETVRSNSDGAFVFTRFDYGDWIVRETKAPEGFCRMEDKTFHVGDDWKAPAPIMCVNIPNHYSFIKTDASGVPLAGVKFRMVDAKGKNMGGYVSGKDGIVHIEGLEPGTYFIKEIETLEGYTLSGEVIKLVIDERYVIPDTMRKMVNYTVIQTGVNMVVTGVMWVGIALMVISGAVGIIRKKRAKH